MGIKKASVLTLVRERPEIVAFVNVFLTMLAAGGHYASLAPYSFHTPGVCSPIVYLTDLETCDMCD
jgi:hypothetical protein